MESENRAPHKTAPLFDSLGVAKLPTAFTQEELAVGSDRRTPSSGALLINTCAGRH